MEPISNIFRKTIYEQLKYFREAVMRGDITPLSPELRTWSIENNIRIARHSKIKKFLWFNLKGENK